MNTRFFNEVMRDFFLISSIVFVAFALPFAIAELFIGVIICIILGGICFVIGSIIDRIIYPVEKKFTLIK